MPSPQKKKGSGWELELTKFFTELYGESFIRTPHSGAFVGGVNQKRKTTLTEQQVRGFKGDIQGPETWDRFNCEAKFYADFPFHQLYGNECKQLEAWLKQLMDVAEPNDCNVLCMKFNRKGKFVAVQLEKFFKNRDFYAISLDFSEKKIYSNTHRDPLSKDRLGCDTGQKNLETQIEKNSGLNRDPLSKDRLGCDTGQKNLDSNSINSHYGSKHHGSNSGFKFNYTLYSSQHYGSWLIADLDSFFEQHSDQVRLLSCSVLQQ